MCSRAWWRDKYRSNLAQLCFLYISYFRFRAPMRTSCDGERLIMTCKTKPFYALPAFLLPLTSPQILPRMSPIESRASQSGNRTTAPTPSAKGAKSQRVQRAIEVCVDSQNSHMIQNAIQTVKDFSGKMCWLKKSGRGICRRRGREEEQTRRQGEPGAEFTQTRVSTV